MMYLLLFNRAMVGFNPLNVNYVMNVDMSREMEVHCIWGCSQHLIGADILLLELLGPRQLEVL